MVCAAGESTVAVEIITARDVPLGGPRAMTVHRTLPQRRRSLIGAWCFIDHYGPDPVSHTGGMDVPPHPHTGLQTVSWLFSGALQHDDSNDIHAIVRPGEVNLMTAGRGICHSEVSTSDTDQLHGVQLWTVLPEHARNGERRFDHYAPQPIKLQGASALVFLGSLFGSTSPIETFTPLVGAEIQLDPHASLAIDVDETFEHGILVDTGAITVEGTPVQRTELAYTGTGATTIHITNTSEDTARLMFLGGTPFEEEIVMWWNFIGRNDEEIRQFQKLWNERDSRFGTVTGYQGHRPDGPAWLPAPPLPTTMLKNRPLTKPIARPGKDPYRPKV
nr:pirin family protein [Corynebacterium aquilae]